MNLLDCSTEFSGDFEGYHLTHGLNPWRIRHHGCSLGIIIANCEFHHVNNNKMRFLSFFFVGYNIT